MLAILLVFMISADSLPAKQKEMYENAVSLYKKGNYRQALEIAEELSSLDKLNPLYSELLGDINKRLGNLNEAVKNYLRVLDLEQQKNVNVLKKLATVYKWMRRYHTAKNLLLEALHLAPKDREAMVDFANLRRKRGVKLFASYGGGEIDYTTKDMRVRFFYGGLDFLDFYAGYSYSDKAFYRRKQQKADLYIFPNYKFYVRLGFRYKTYEYPPSINPNPDINAYATIPDGQIELAYYYRGDDHFSIELEYFKPNFFWNKSLYADNFKLSGTWRTRVFGPVYFKAYGALLHDPDPATFVMDTLTNTVKGFKYERLGLLGGAIGVSMPRWDISTKVIPDRDLDRSTDYSVFADISYDPGTWKFSYDYLLDKYSKFSYRAGQLSHVHMLTVRLKQAGFADVLFGVKYLIRDKKSQITPFIALNLLTGIGF